MKNRGKSWELLFPKEPILIQQKYMVSNTPNNKLYSKYISKGVKKIKKSINEGKKRKKTMKF